MEPTSDRKERRRDEAAAVTAATNAATAATNAADIATNAADIATNAADIATLETVTDVGAWTAVSFSTGWSDFGSGWQAAQYRKVGDEVQLRGLVKRTAADNEPLFTLPSGFRPPAHQMWPCMAMVLAGSNIAAAVRVEISYSTGVVSLDGDADYGDEIGVIYNQAMIWVDLAIIQFSVTA